MTEMTGRLVALAVLTGACTTAGRQADPAECAPVRAPAESLDVARLEGTFRLTVVRTGADSGSAVGRLVLRPQVDSLVPLPGAPGSRMPMIGTAVLDVAAVGGAVAGTLESADPLRPGVAVLEGPDGVMLRLGSAVNTRGERPFDAAFFALTAQEVSDTGFRGSWRSGSGMQGASGYFCATRMSDR